MLRARFEEWVHRTTSKENAMNEQQKISFEPAVRALRGLGIAAIAGAACMAGAHGAMLDDGAWRDEIVARGDELSDDGWYELQVTDNAVRVVNAQPRCGETGSADSLFVHLPRARLLEGLRVNHAFGGLQPVVGQAYPMTLGKTDFTLRVESSAAGTQYVIRYDGVTYYYLLGLPAAATQVHAIADLDGDRKPDFVVEVGDELYLLLSSQARAGVNLPSAQVWAAE